MDKSQEDADVSDRPASTERPDDLAHTKVDPYQDPAYHAPLQSPSHALDTSRPAPSEDADDSESAGQHDPVVPGCNDKLERAENSDRAKRQSADDDERPQAEIAPLSSLPDAWVQSGYIF